MGSNHTDIRWTMLESYGAIVLRTRQQVGSVVLQIVDTTDKNPVVMYETRNILVAQQMWCQSISVLVGTAIHQRLYGDK